MHIPDSMLQGSICPLTAVVSTAGVAVAAYYGLKSREKPKASRFAAITALIFALQMMNFPISDGTSGHLLGGVLAASLLGTPFGVLSIALVVAIQTLVFSDGGLTVLGANIFNMAILGAGAGGLLRSKLVTHWKGNRGEYAATSVAAWFSVVLASLAVSVELTFDGQIAFFNVISAMVGTHAIIGVGESFITIACCFLLSTHNVTTQTKGKVAVPFTASVVVALLLSPFASGFPDGLEWVAQKYRFLHESAPAFVSPMPDYVFPYITNEAFSTGVAGLLGVIITFGVAWFLFRMMESPTVKQKIA